MTADYAAEKRKSSPKAFNGMGIGAQTAIHINAGLPNLFAPLNAEVQG